MNLTVQLDLASSKATLASLIKNYIPFMTCSQWAKPGLRAALDGLSSIPIGFKLQLSN